MIFTTQVTTLLNSLEFVIVPFVNPDGYDVSALRYQPHFTHGHLILLPTSSSHYPPHHVIMLSNPPHHYPPHHLIIHLIVLSTSSCYPPHHVTHLIMLPTSSCHPPHRHVISLLQYTWTNDRLWRKNRRPGTTCDGVDLNRNYNIKWGGVSGNKGYIEVNGLWEELYMEEAGRVYTVLVTINSSF